MGQRAIHTESVHRRSCYFTGRVQGVGFRYTVKNIAMQFNVGGYVRNLPDGRVELIMEGADGEMDQLLEELRSRMDCYIRKVDTDVSNPTGEFDQFYIRH